jgi:hypothetical protein
VGPPFRLISRFQRLKTWKGYTLSWGVAQAFSSHALGALSLKIFAIFVCLFALREGAALLRAFSATNLHLPLTWGVAPGYRISRLWRFDSNAFG